ncbi:hypothetical protein [Pigmentiphaga litoralis]|uniref:hypothetical protein n=1 Tax=Pigmentiphaga litoralis TaxID=516702 RepID=UPI001678B1D7|nr:hypothetical protein [Pigmentiphaga litoralis]
MIRNAAASATIAFLTGCGGSLYVADENWNAQPGIPFRATEVYVMRGVLNKHTEGKDCDNTPFVRTLPLPAGAQYFVAFKGAMLAKSEFSVNFGPNGTLSSVTLNSEPGASETLRATSDLLKYALPVATAATGGGLLGTTFNVSTPFPVSPEVAKMMKEMAKRDTEISPPDGAEPPKAPPKIACNSGEDKVTLLPLSADLEKYR